MSTMFGMVLRGLGMGDAADYLTSGEGQAAAMGLATDVAEMRRDISIMYQSMVRTGAIISEDITDGIARCGTLPGLQLSDRNRTDGH